MRAFRVRSLIVCALVATPLSAQTVWTGAVSSSWNTSANWSTGVVPGSATDVVIAATVNSPSNFLLDPECHDLTIDPGATLSLIGGFDLSVGGTLQIDGTLDVLSSSSELDVTQGWVNNGTFNGGGATVVLSGSGVLAGSTSTAFEELVVSGGTRTASTAFSASDGVSVEGGATLNLGALTHSVSGTWISSGVGASVVGTGMIDFVGSGLMITGGNSIPNARISAGTRSVNTSAVAGNLELVGGTLQLLDNATLSVGGDAALTSGTLEWVSSFAGTETLDVAGNVIATCTAGATSDDARLACGGTWSSTAAFAMALGTVVLDGGGAATVTGTTPVFPTLQILSGAFTFDQPTHVTGNLLLNSGNLLDTNAVMDIDGNVIMGDGTAEWQLSGLSHTVAGDYTSFGANATGPGIVVLDGDGAIAPGGGTIANLTIVAGTRIASNASILGDLVMTGGELGIADGQTLAVAGNGMLTGGALGWLNSSFQLEVLDVEGDLTITCAVGTTSGDSRIECSGNWTSSAAFAPTSGMVILNGGGSQSVSGAGVTLADVEITSGVVTMQSAASVGGSLAVRTGATLITDGVLDIAGNVELAGASALWNMGGLTHSVEGSWLSSGASATVGTIVFDGNGGLDTGGGSIANVRVNAGSRNVSSSEVTGDFEVVGGALQILDDQQLTIGGNMSLTSGILNFEPTTAGGLEVIDVAGDVLAQVGVTLSSDNTVIRCAGSWISDAAFAPASGTIELAGSIETVGGVGTTLPNLTILSGAKQVQAPIALTGNLRLESGAVLDTEASLDIEGNVTLGDATATWDLSAFSHNIAGDWISSGASATGASGVVRFDGPGALDTSVGTISNVEVLSGARIVAAANVDGNLTMTGGSIVISDNQTVDVGGNANLSAGTLSFDGLTPGLETLIVAGDVAASCVFGTNTETTRIECSGNWSSTAAFAPAFGTTVFLGGGATTIGGTNPVLANVRIDDGVRTMTSDLAVTSLVLVSGASLQSNGVLTSSGQVLLGDPTAAWDMGGLTHVVSGPYTSAGCDATNGTLEMDGIGGFSTGSGTVDNIVVSDGVRNVQGGSVVNDAVLSGGLLRILNDATLAIGGDFDMTGGMVSWEPTPGGVNEVIDVEGNVVANAAVDLVSPNSVLSVGGDWTSDGTFAPVQGLVQLDAGGVHTVGGAAPTFANLEVVDGQMTLASNMLVAGDLTLNSGNLLVSAASADIDGDVFLGDASAEWDLGAFTHTVAGNWDSAGASATGAGTVEFDATGSVATGAGSISNLSITGGDRLCSGTNVTGNVLMTGGGLLIGADQTMNVGGDLALTAGTFGWDPATGGALEVLDVEGNATVLATLSTESEDSRFFCGGDWSSSSAYSPALGEVVLDGATPATVSGASPIFPNLTIESGTTTVTSASTIVGDLQLNSGSILETDAALDIDGNAALGDATAVWDLGTGLTHTVAGFWVSLGASALDLSSTVEFDGPGILRTGGGTITNVLVSAGNRAAQDSDLTGDLTMTGGGFVVGDNQTVTVAGNMDLQGGLLGFTDTTAGTELIDVEGDVSIVALTGATSDNSAIHCAGNWNSTSAYTPALGTVTLDGGSVANVTGAGGIVLADLVVDSGSKTLGDGIQLDDLTVVSGATWTTNGSVDAGGDVSLGDATASWAMGGLVHNVSGSWTSAGASATLGTVEFDGDGGTTTATGSIANLRSVTGERDMSDTEVTGFFELSGGNMTLLNDQTLLVGGDAVLTGGVIDFAPGVDGTPELLDVEGSLLGTANVTVTSDDTLIRCGGNWSSNGSFALTSGVVELDGAGTTLLAAAGPGFNPIFDEVVIRNGTRQVASVMGVTSNRWTIEVGAALENTGFTVTLPGATTFVQGELALFAGGQLGLNSSSLVNVAGSGTLRMVGAIGDEAAIVGVGGGGYLLSIDGMLSANNFRFEEMGAGGVTLTRLATVDAAPNDMRQGVFSNPSSTAGSTLLDLRRASPTTFFNVDFEDPLGVGTFNVRTNAGAAVTFQNSTGNLAGEAFDDDPFEFVTWETDSNVTLASFTATAGEGQITVDWTSSIELGADEFLLRRSEGLGGPYSLVAQLPVMGPSAYQVIDAGLMVGQVYEYQLAWKPLVGGEQILGVVNATPTGPSFPPNVFAVGGGGPFADIQSAIDGSSGPRRVIRVAAGTYPAFVVTPGFGTSMRILSDGSGPIVIDTTLQPVTVFNLGANEPVVISDLQIGDGTGTNPGILIQGAVGAVILDELQIQGGAGAAGVAVDSSGRVALQRTTVTGAPGVDVFNGSNVYASKGAVGTLELADFSVATTCELTGTPTVEPGSTLNALTGLMPDVDAPEFSALGANFSVTVSGEIGDFWLLFFSLDLGWLPLPPPGFEMVGLTSVSATLLTSGLFSTGSQVVPAALPLAPTFVGLPIVLQGVSVDLVTTAARFSNVTSVVGLNP